MEDQGFTQNSPGANVPAPDAAPAEQIPAGPQDITNQMIHSPYMGNATTLSDPSAVLKDPNAPVDDKTAALDLFQQKQAEQRAQQTQQAQQIVAEKAKAFDAWQNANEKYDRIAEAAKNAPNAITMPPRPDPEKFGLSVTDISSLSNPKTQQAIVPALKDQAQKDQADTFAQQQKDALVGGMQKAAIQQNTIEGYMAQQNKIAQHQQDLMDQSIKAVDDKQYELDKIDPNRFWNNLSGGQRILGTLAVALGSLHQGSNPAMDMINKSIDRDIDSQKLTNENKIAMKTNALKRIGLEIEKYGQMSKDNDKKMQMGLLVDQIKTQRDSLAQQQAQTIALNKQLSSGGLPPDQFNLLVTDKEQQKKAVALPNGNITVAPVEPTAEDRKALLDKTNGKKLLQEYRDLFNNASAIDKANPYSEVGQRLRTYRQAIGGLMHVDLVGPGPYTEQKQKKVDDILGNLVFTTPELFNSRIGAIQNLLTTSTKNAYNAIGVRLPITPADKMRQKLYQMNQYKPEEVEAAVKAAAQKDPKYAE